MKRNPILFRKLTQEGKVRFREVIGLIGTHRGAGVTYTGLMLAFYYGEELGRKTAFLECNQHHDMSLIQKVYDWSGEEENGFSYQRITCYREARSSRITQILGEDYESIILDFGTDLLANKDEWLRCTTKIVISGQSEWDILKLKEFVRNTQQIQGSEHWLYFLPLGRKRTIDALKKEIKRRVWAVPDIKEPTRPDSNAKQFIKQSLSSR